MAYSAYCDYPTLVSWNCEYCNTDKNLGKIVPKYYAIKTTSNGFALVAQRDNTIIVSFRGTQPTNLDNLFTDLKMIMVPFNDTKPDVKVHSGFLKLYLDLKPQVESAIRSLMEACPHCDHLEVTGHSLGGSLATLMVYDLYPSVFNKKLSFYTFGSPRVGNQEFVNDFVAKIGDNINHIWRMVEGTDIIPQFPQYLLGYRHLPHEVWLEKEGGIKNICLGIDEEKCQRSLPFIRLGIRAHSNYFGISSMFCDKSDYPILSIGK
ncbi:hypothetical protein SAMD00019534_068470 [Acytostelium subglobosum LB1]|uniref:hypothetical protein n=1 Tax=Acytostelium subglobosum LB1 TaxID=1410327 RepID=UPI000644F306|nr:hypothetical protein SAMD00019534_068470 [Acytostelium subglobosum LB1]GAM23672.1 hypothetical protein SAMD00019534_068470 [Acytostelium subglobosum LB1]|eukprot:XP_012753413.1 hypothetical protein SAMD00019534_068470 [Acytostelium subglobosum LB1]